VGREVLRGMLIWIAGFLFYRNQLPDERNPITRILYGMWSIIPYSSLFPWFKPRQTDSAGENSETRSDLLYQQVKFQMQEIKFMKISIGSMKFMLGNCSGVQKEESSITRGSESTKRNSAR
jgi:hypothetical protein